MIAVGSLIFVLPLHPDVRNSALDQTGENSDEEMLDNRADETAGLDSSLGLDIWVSPKSMRIKSRRTGIYEEPGKIKAEAMVID